VDEHEHEHDTSTTLTVPMMLVGVALAILVIGVVGALIAVVRSVNFNSTISLAYYISGSVIFLVGAFPRGGFSVVRGRTTQRHPTGGGPYAVPTMILGVALIGVGLLIEWTGLF